MKQKNPIQQVSCRACASNRLQLIAIEEGDKVSLLHLICLTCGCLQAINIEGIVSSKNKEQFKPIKNKSQGYLG